MQLDWQFASPLRLMLVIVIVAVGFIARRHYLFTEPLPGLWTRRLLTSMRVIVLAIIILLIASPSILITKNEDILPEIVIAVDNSLSMQIDDSLYGSRWDTGKRYASMVDSLLADRPVEIHLLSGNGFGQMGRLDGQPESTGSDIGQMVVQSSRYNRNISGVILVSDGHSTVSRSNLRNSPGVQTALVGVGDIAGPPDLVLHNVRVPEIAYSGEKLIIEADIGVSGISDQHLVNIVLSCEDKVVGSYEGLLGSGDSVLHMEIPFIPESTGLQLLELTCEPLVNERFQSNNKVSMAVTVHPGRSRVLMLTNKPNWDVKFMSRAALLEHRLELFVAYKTPSGWTLSDSLTAWELPTDKDDWLQWDGVILGDYQGPVIGLEDAVDAGCGLLVLDGNSRFDSLTGVRSTGVVQGDWLLRRAEIEQQHPLLNGLYGVPLDINSHWLSPMSEVVSCETNGQVLLEAVWKQTLPLLVVNENSTRRVAWFGSNELWSMQFWQPASDITSHPVVKLAQNMLAWVADGDRSGKIALSGKRNVYDVGQVVQITGVLADSDLAAVSAQLINLESGKTTEYSMFGAGEGRYALELPHLEPGKYSVSVDGAELNFAVVESGVESTQITQNISALKSIANTTGAEYFNGESQLLASDLLEQFDMQPRTGVIRTRYNLGSSWWLVAGIILLLSVEWFTRRRLGML